MAAAGLRLDDVTEVVLTHAHGDHIDGTVHFHERVLINETELRYASSPFPSVMRRVLRQPLPPRLRPADVRPRSNGSARTAPRTRRSTCPDAASGSSSQSKARAGKTNRRAGPSLGAALASMREPCKPLLRTAVTVKSAMPS
jgi:Metallo-beta-lactamase superfamily